MILSSAPQSELRFNLQNLNTTGMKLAKLTVILRAVGAVIATSARIPISEVVTPLGPSMEHAERNAFQVFNTIHAAMRQWDSSVNHNGMSYFVASIPSNALLYHGTRQADAVQGMEWLAFEIEHADVFGRAGLVLAPGSGNGHDLSSRSPAYEDMRHSCDDDLVLKDSKGAKNGYLHVYKTKNPLTKILYLDGMAAGKTTIGTLDTQVLFYNSSIKIPEQKYPLIDLERAHAMCNLTAEHGIEGIIRMQAGFELVLCDFSSGVDLVSVSARPEYESDEDTNDLHDFEYLRGISLRYDDITASRVCLDFSSMVSAFFYPLNLTNPDPQRPELPRLPISDTEGLARLKSDVVNLFKEYEAGRVTVNWQGVADMIVTRYADRLQYMIHPNTTRQSVLTDLNFLLNPFVDYQYLSIPAAVEKCTSHYTLPVTPMTQSDRLIHVSISTVTRQICSSLFSARALLLAHPDTKSNIKPNNGASSFLTEAKSLITNLTHALSWPIWKKCGPCAYDEICYIASWPWGQVEDHFNPRCKRAEELVGSGYWGEVG